MKYVITFGDYYYISTYTQVFRGLTLAVNIQDAKWFESQSVADQIAKRFGGQVMSLHNVLKEV